MLSQLNDQPFGMLLPLPQYFPREGAKYIEMLLLASAFYLRTLIGSRKDVQREEGDLSCATHDVWFTVLYSTNFSQYVLTHARG
jgi:hypothetical protein